MSEESGTPRRLEASADLDLLAALEARAFTDPWSRAALEPLFAAGAGEAYVAFAGNGRPAGYALFQLLPGECELLRVGVVPEARRRGLAKALLGAALARLAAAGRPVCHLEVRAGNEAARALYSALDFVLVGRRRGYYGDGEDAVRYRRDAPPQRA
jgi:ribosomal-protein-alanine N-acetyltransferase